MILFEGPCDLHSCYYTGQLYTITCLLSDILAVSHLTSLKVNHDLLWDIEHV